MKIIDCSRQFLPHGQTDISVLSALDEAKKGTLDKMDKTAKR